MKKALLLLSTLWLTTTMLTAQHFSQSKGLEATRGVAFSLRAGTEFGEGFCYFDRESAKDPNNILGIGTGDADLFFLTGIILPQAEGLNIKGIEFLQFSNNETAKIYIASRTNNTQDWNVEHVEEISNLKAAEIASFTFKTPVTTVASKEYLVGYEIKSTAKENFPVGMISGSDGVPGGAEIGFDSKSLIQDNKITNIEDLSSLGFGNLAIVVALDDPNGVLQNSASFSSPVLPQMEFVGNSIPAEKTKTEISLQNKGLNAIQNVTIETILPDGTKSEQDYAVSKDAKVIVEVGEISNKGNNEVTFVLKKVNGTTNGCTNEELITCKKIFILLGEEDVVLRESVLVERFTGEKCPNCPSGEERIAQALTKIDFPVIVAVHHVGYGDDFLTLKESNTLLIESILPPHQTNSFAPAYALNRIADPELVAMAPNLGSDFGMYMLPGDPEIIEKQLRWVKEKPSFGKITGVSKEQSGQEYKLTITGVVTNPYERKSTYVTVYRVQDNIDSRNQAGASADFKHNSTITKFATPYTGEEITCDDQGNFSHVINHISEDRNWTDEERANMRYVIFIHQKVDNKDYFSRKVYSVVEMSINATSGVKEVSELHRPIAYAQEGCIFFNRDVDSFVAYNVAGQIVATNSHTQLSQGVYLVKAKLGEVEYISKVVVK